jgi:hypothetical protein
MMLLDLVGTREAVRLLTGNASWHSSGRGSRAKFKLRHYRCLLLPPIEILADTGFTETKHR